MFEHCYFIDIELALIIQFYSAEEISVEVHLFMFASQVSLQIKVNNLHIVLT